MDPCGTERFCFHPAFPSPEYLWWIQPGDAPSHTEQCALCITGLQSTTVHVCKHVLLGDDGIGCRAVRAKHQQNTS